MESTNIKHIKYQWLKWQSNYLFTKPIKKEVLAGALQGATSFEDVI